MQTVMNIMVTVQGARHAQGQLKGVAAATSGVTAASAAAATGGAAFVAQARAGAVAMERYGKNMQWAGRQIEYNFTLPILAATGFAAKWAMDTERSMTRLRKVYFDTGRDAKEMAAEIDLLGQGFRILSDHFGVAQDEVAAIGARWAQAGARGAAVARGTRLTLEAMILGSMEAEEAVDALITMQMAYKLNTEELTLALAQLNAIENETAASLPHLITGFRRSAGVAREAGVEIRELGAMLAALQPAYANASQAGNAMRTIITRIMSPTTQSMELFREAGLAVDEAAWHSSNFTERLHLMHDAFDGLSRSQVNFANTVVAGRFQVARMSGLLASLTDENGMYQKALRATQDDEEVRLRMLYEINEVLGSQPMLFKRAMNEIKNLAQEIVGPLIPALIGALAQVRNLLRAFSNLSPQVQSFILFTALAVAALGPFIRTLGASILLVAMLSKGLLFFAGAILKILEVMKVTAVLGLLRTKMGLLLKFMAAKTAAVLGYVASLWTEFARFLGRALIVASTEIKIFAIKMQTVWGPQIAAAFSAKVAAIKVQLGLMITYIRAAVIPALVNYVRAVYASMVASVRAVVVAVAAKVAAFKAMLFPALAAAGTAFIRYAGVVIASSKAMLVAVVKATIPLIIGAMVALKGALVVAGGAIVGAVGTIVAALATISAPVWLTIAAVTLLVTGIVLLFTRFRDSFFDHLRSIREGAQAIPRFFASALRTTFEIVKTAAMAIYEALQRLNPFARFSPSLVESVRDGVAIIAREYSSLSSIAGVFDRAVASLQRFKSATQRARASLRAEELGEQRSTVVSVAPGAGGAFDALVRNIAALEGALDRVGRQYARQEAVVARLRRGIDALNARLTDQRHILQDLQSALRDTETALRDAESALSDLASMPIKGMRKYEDQLFKNEQAQKRLRLEILKLEEAHGPVDDLRDKMARLQGDIESMVGERADLRLAGAGSDILGFYDQQINEMRGAQRALMEGGGAGGPAEEISKLREELDRLRREAEMMELERDLKFDPLTRQIKDLIDGYEEMPFSRIVSEIKKQQKEVEKLTKTYERQQAAVDAQQGIVDALELRQRTAQRVYDAENRKLTMLRDSYQGLQQTLREMESELSSFVSAAEAAIRRAEAAAREAAGAADGAGTDPAWLENFRNAIGDFDVPGGDAGIGWEEGLEDLIEEWRKEMEDAFGDFDLWEIMKKPFIDGWNAWRRWSAGNWEKVKTWFRGLWSDWQGTGLNAFGEAIWDWFTVDIGALIADYKDLWERIKTTFSNGWERVKTIWDGIPDILKDPWGVSTEWIMTKAGEFAERLPGKMRELRDDVKEKWDAIPDIIKDPWGVTTEWVIETATNFNERLKEKQAELGADLRERWEGIRERVSSAWGRATDWVTERANTFGARFMSKMRELRDDVGERWEGARERMSSAWGRGTDWVQRNATNFGTRFMSKMRELRDDVRDKWEGARERMSSAWGRGVDWVDRNTNGFVTRFRGKMRELRDDVRERWESVRATTVSMWGRTRDAVSGAVDKIKQAVRSARDGIGRLWDGIRTRLRKPIAAAVDVAINPFIQGVNRILNRVPGVGTLSEVRIPQFHKGGVVGKDGEARSMSKPLGSDEMLAVLRRGERVLTAGERRLLENDPAYAQPEVGGVLSWARGVASGVADTVRGQIADVIRPMINAALSAVERIPGGDSFMGQAAIGLSRQTGDAILKWLTGIDDEMPTKPELGTGVGWQSMWAAVRDQFGFARLTSALRPGARTATGNQSYHALGRAVDLAGQGFMNHAQMLQINRWIAENYRAQTKELIYSGPGGKQLHNGRDHFYTGITRAMHFDHVHWAMDQGGMLRPGWNQPIFNGTGRPEIVSPERLMRRIFREEIRRTGEGGKTEINIYGNLEFPNIESGQDAEDFITNLESMVN